MDGGRYDAVIYSRALGARSPGTHNLHLVDDADHNFTGVSAFTTKLAFDETMKNVHDVFSGRTRLWASSWTGGHINRAGS